MANTLITAANLPNLLIPGVRGIMGDYEFYNNEWKQFFTTLSSVKNTEVDIEKTTLNAAARFGESSDIPLGMIRQLFVTNSQMFQYGVGFTITAIAIEDNLYPDEFPKGMLGIKENLNILSEYEGIALFDNAFSTANPEYVLGSGQSLCSATQPLATNQTFSNTISPAQLNETSAQSLVISINYFKDASGLPRKFMANKYLVGIDNQFAVDILSGSAYSPNNTTNAINPLTHSNYYPAGYVISHYMANSFNFFALTNYKEGLVHYSRKSLEIQMTTDQANRNLAVYGNMRYRFRGLNCRAVAGCQSFGA